MWRGEVRERAVRARRKPGGGKGVRSCSGHIASSDPRVTKHESRTCGRCVLRRRARDAQPETHARTLAPADRSPLSCALRRGMGRLWRGMGGRRPPCRQHSLLGFHQPRTTQHVFPCPPATSRSATPIPANGFSRITNHESRITAFMFFTNHGLPCVGLTLPKRADTIRS